VTGRRVRTPDEQSLRRAALRIGLQTGAAVAITIIGLVAVAIVVLLHSQRAADAESLTAAVAHADDVTDPPAGVWLVLYRHDTQVATPGMPTWLPDQPEITRVVTDRTAATTDFAAGRHAYRVRTEPLPGGGVVQALLDLHADDVQRSSLLAALLAAGLTGLLLAVAVGAWAARRAVVPLADALSLQRRFIADASHELRTPLTLLSTRAQLIRRALRRESDRATLGSDVDSLVRDAHQLADILDDLLMAADRRGSPHDIALDLPSVVGEAVESASPYADERGIGLCYDPGGTLPRVTGARAALRRAVIALLDNAIRHAHTGVEVTVGGAGHWVFVDVADDGAGLDPNVASTVFDRFAAAPEARREGERRRYGIGLALVSEIAARHGGSVAVVDTGHGGATFRLRLPAC
jgi:signal transduction histidine kinase